MPSTLISPMPSPSEPPIESTIYVRVDYFHWNENVDHTDFVNENGELTTVGYQARCGPRRFRSEIFGSQVNYGAPLDFPGDPNDFLSSQTDYIGGRYEAEWIYDPDRIPGLSLFGGLGTRFWLRHLPGDVSDNGFLIGGYDEKWWTIYPYMGLESRRNLKKATELYAMARVGITAITWQWVTLNDVLLYPRPGVTEQLEAGIRGPHLFAAAFFEGMAWNASEIVYANGWLQSQPTSTMYTVGLKTGINF